MRGLGVESANVRPKAARRLRPGIGVLARRSLGCCLPWRLVDRAQHLDAMARAEIDENSGRVSTV